VLPYYVVSTNNYREIYILPVNTVNTSTVITFITVTKKRFSSSSCIAPLIDPIAQHNYNIYIFYIVRNYCDITRNRSTSRIISHGSDHTISLLGINYWLYWKALVYRQHTIQSCTGSDSGNNCDIYPLCMLARSLLFRATKLDRITHYWKQSVFTGWNAHQEAHTTAKAQWSCGQHIIC